MEQQATTASTPPPTRRAARSSRLSPNAHSRPSTPQAGGSNPRHTNTSGLSTSEPTLRFPRPQGSKYLAHWISASDPDIMRMHTTTDDAGLSESTYELVSAADTEFQDDNENYTSISESIGSLDISRPDDVHSLAGTEHTYDDESVVDEAETRTGTQLLDPLDSDDEGQDDTMVPESQNQSDSESDEEARSRSSLEYTQHHLKTPSILTPEASKILERKPESFRVKLNNGLVTIWNTASRFKDYTVEAATAAIPGLIFAAIIAILISVVYSPSSMDTVAHLPSTASTITATTAPAVATSSKPRASLQTSASTGGAGLIPLDSVSDEWLFGPKKPAVSFTSQNQGDVLVHVATSVKQHWLRKDCLAVKATRGDSPVVITMSSVQEGMLLKFPRKEAHGVVELSFKATCRPKIEKVVKVHFGKGIMEEAFEMTKHLAQDLSGLVPAAAQEAERRFEGAKQSAKQTFGCASGIFGQNIQSASQKALKTFNAAVAGTRHSLDVVKWDAQQCFSRVKHVAEELTSRIDLSQQTAAVQDVQNQLQLGLLDAQISAKMWWLKASGQTEQRDNYERKARDFVAKKQAAAKEARKAREPSKPRFWSGMMSGRGKGNQAGGRRGTQSRKGRV